MLVVDGKACRKEGTERDPGVGMLLREADGKERLCPPFPLL